MLTKQKFHQLRILLVLCACMAGVIALGFRIYCLQVLDVEQLADRSQRQHRGLLRLQPERGCIYDRNQWPMALNSGRCCLRLHPNKWSGGKSGAAQLAKALGVESASLTKRIGLVCARVRRAGGNLRSDVLYFNLTPEQRQAVEALDLPGLSFSEGTGRVYPGGTLAASTLGFVGLERRGLEGLERHFDETLKGRVGRVQTLRDGKGEILSWTDVTELKSTRGADLVLSLDRYIQFLAEKELEVIAEKYDPNWASIVIMEPYSGEVLALANWPTYDPNHVEFSKAAGRKNYAVCEVFEPGSTIKTFTMAAALEGEYVEPDTKIYCEDGAYRVHRHTIRDDIHAFGELTVEEVLAYSSNIGTVKIAEMMGREPLYDMLHNLHFGRRTGVCFPGEGSGLLRHPRKWSGQSIAAIPFGQEMQTTTLGLASAYCAVANGGFYQSPQLVLATRNPSTGNWEEKDKGRVEQVMPQETAAQLSRMLVAVTEYGTADKARVEGYDVAGKTGTAQIFDRELGRYSRKKHLASFIGFLPAGNPRVVIAVVVNQPQGAKYGNSIAGPAFASLGEEIMKYLQVLPTKPEKRNEVAVKLFKSYQGEKEFSTTQAPPWRQQLNRGLVLGMTMREAYERLRSRGLPVAFRGSGIALEQSIRPARTRVANTSQALEVKFFPPSRLKMN
jgi:cell division protein FtsI (penicillin-binding protein 3)